MSSSFEQSPSISFVIVLELMILFVSSITSRPVLKDIGRPFKTALVSERKQVCITDCENKTVVIFSLEGGKTIEHKFKEPTGIAFLPVLDVAECTLVRFAKNGDEVLDVNFPKKISIASTCVIFSRGWECHFPCIKH